MTLAQAKRRFLTAQKRFEDAILAELDRVARRHKLDEMVFGLGTYLERNGKEVKIKRIKELDELYCEHICSGGFQGVWTKENGW